MSAPPPIKKDNSQILALTNALEELSQTDFIKESDFYSSEFAHIIERLKDDEFKIAVAGEFSSGKSTFLNALIGKDILKHGTTETTATITEIQNVNTANQTFDVYFLNGDRKENVPLEKLVDYTATASKVCSVAQEIERVVIKSNVLGNSDKVSLIDTPGLNGIADNHREKTIEQIKNSHACFYLLHIRGISESDIHFLKFISRYQKNIIFIQNFIDELKQDEGETPEKKAAEQRAILDEHVFNDDVSDDSSHDAPAKSHNYEIIPISAKKALLSHDKNIKENDGIALTDEMRETLFEQSNFARVFEELNSLMEKNKSGNIQQRDCASVALEIIDQLQTILEQANRQELDEFESSDEGKMRKGIEKMLEQLNEGKEKNKSSLENFVESGSMEIRSALFEKVKAELEQIYQSISRTIEEQENIESFEAYIKESLGYEINSKLSQFQRQCNEYINMGFGNLWSNAVLRVNYYTNSNGNVEGTSSRIDFSSAIKGEDLTQFEKAESDIERHQKERERLEDELKSARTNIAEMTNKINADHSDLNSQKSKMQEVERNRNYALSRLGQKPEVEKKTRWVTHTKRFLFIKWESKPEEQNYEDPTKQNEWLRKKGEIERQYTEEMNSTNSKIKMIESRLKQTEDDLESEKRSENTTQMRLNSVKTLLDSKIKLLEEQKKRSREEYLRNCKKTINFNVNEFLTETVKERTKENFERNIQNCKNTVMSHVLNLFETLFNERIRNLKSRISSETSEEYVSKSQKALVVMEKTRKTLEDFLWQDQ